MHDQNIRSRHPSAAAIKDHRFIVSSFCMSKEKSLYIICNIISKDILYICEHHIFYKICKTKIILNRKQQQ